MSDAVQVYLALLPLLSKQVVVDEVRIDGLRANLIKLSNGKTNFSDLAGGGARAVEKNEVPGPLQRPEMRRRRSRRSNWISAEFASPARGLPGATRPTATTSAVEVAQTQDRSVGGPHAESGGARRDREGR